MKIIRNESTLDRLLRTWGAVLLAVGSFFWVGGILSIVLYILAAVFLFTAISGFCGLYLPFGINTYQPGKKTNRIAAGIIILFIIVTAIAGSYYSAFFSRKFFLEDFNRMNQPYKQTLFETGQGKRAEAIFNYENLVVEHERFQKKYISYRPYSLRNDKQFAADVSQVAEIIATIEPAVRSGDLAQAHLDLEAIRPVYQDLLKRNGFSMLAVYLVDFHDAMEKVLDAATDKDQAGVSAAYVEADNRLKTVEDVANDDEIKAIRANLEAVLEAARNGQTDALPDLGAQLKSSFVKVYLKRG
ncbi:MAG: DUF2892 domain-containing protein [Patescibacteria group bacterium]